MKQIETVTEYVSKLFERYSMSDYEFTHYFDDDTEEMLETPLFPYGISDDETLEKISINFGITKEEILSIDENAATRYWNKYKFFSLYKKYLHLWEWNQKYKDPEPTAEDFLINAIFTENEGIPIRLRHPRIKERLISKLKEYDRVFPGTYHDGAEITDLYVSTQTLFSFPECGDMIRSFLNMVDRLQELFFKAIKEELPQDEINELNFLACWLNARDVVAPDTYVTYRNVRCYRNVYIEEGHTDFYEYAKIKAFIGTEPWRCQEFLDDENLVLRFVNVFPQTKHMMWEFGLQLTKLSCDFVWSDAKPIPYSEDEEWENEFFGWEPIPEEKRAKERTFIYLDKNSEEMPGWESYTKKLKKAYGPVSKGGIVVPSRTPNVGLARKEKRIKAKIEYNPVSTNERQDKEGTPNE